jgi:transcriptional regulator with XRE-family HTH domain
MTSSSLAKLIRDAPCGATGAHRSCGGDWVLGKPGDIDVRIGGRIRYLRKSAGLSQIRLAEKIGVSFQQLQKYESGNNRVSAGQLFQIAACLETSIELFFPFTEQQAAPSSKLDPETIALNFLSSGDNWKLFCAFRRIADLEKRKSVLAMAEQMAG